MKPPSHTVLAVFADMNLQSDDFELFGVPRRFAQERSALDARWKELQREAHPDRHAASTAAVQRQAMQWSVRINEAYQRIKDPLRRAAYLCELNGAPIRAEDNTAMPADFLVQQMEWREALKKQKIWPTSMRWKPRCTGPPRRSGALRRFHRPATGLCCRRPAGQSPHVHCAFCAGHRTQAGATGTIGS